MGRPGNELTVERVEMEAAGLPAGSRLYRVLPGPGRVLPTAVPALSGLMRSSLR